MPKIKQLDISDKSTLIIWKITEELDDLISKSNLKGEDLKKLSLLKSTKRKKEWIATRALINSHFTKEYFIDYKQNGAPFLNPNDFKISISHSNNLVGVLINNDPRTGLDVQKFSNKIELIQNKFLSLYERDCLNKTSEKSLYLHLIWCAKEVAYKTFDIKGLSFSDDLNVPLFDFAKHNSFICELNRLSIKIDLKLNYMIMDGYLIVYTIE